MVRYLFDTTSHFTQIYCLEHDYFNGEWFVEYFAAGYNDFCNQRSFLSTEDKPWIYPSFDFASVDQARIAAVGTNIRWNTIYSLSICEEPYYSSRGFSSIYFLFCNFRVSHDLASTSVFWLSPAKHLLCKGLPIVNL